MGMNVLSVRQLYYDCVCKREQSGIILQVDCHSYIYLYTTEFTTLTGKGTIMRKIIKEGHVHVRMNLTKV